MTKTVSLINLMIVMEQLSLPNKMKQIDLNIDNKDIYPFPKSNDAFSEAVLSNKKEM